MLDRERSNENMTSMRPQIRNTSLKDDENIQKCLNEVEAALNAGLHFKGRFNSGLQVWHMGCLSQGAFWAAPQQALLVGHVAMSDTLQKCLTELEAADAPQTSRLPRTAKQLLQALVRAKQVSPSACLLQSLASCWESAPAMTAPDLCAKTLQVIAGSGTDLDEPQSSHPPDQHPPSGSDVSMEATPPAKRRVHIIIPEAGSSKQQSTGGPGMRNKPPRCRPAV